MPPDHEVEFFRGLGFYKRVAALPIAMDPFEVLGMAEIEFFAVEEEIAEVVNWLVGQGCALAPDSNYDSADIMLMTGALEIRQTAISVQHFFVIREDLLESPIDVREVTTTDKHFFYISPRTGGPSLQFFWGRHTEREARQRFSTSGLSYYPWYKDSVTGERKKISKDLLKIYSGCAKLIRTRCGPHRPGGQVSRSDLGTIRV